MPAFDALTTPVASGETFTLHVPTGWRQGRGAFGGFCIAAMIRAIERCVGDPARKLRTLTAEFAAPVDVGDATISIDILRSGASVTVARATLTQSDGIKAHAVAVLASARKNTIEGWQDLVPPTAPPWNQVPTVPVNPMFPEFAQHFEYRVVEGVPTMGGEARTLGWVRAREPGPTRDAAYIAALADVWWPATLVRVKTMRPIVTISYTLELVGDFDGLDSDEPLLYRGVVPVMLDEGYFVETRELWGHDGRLIARNHQTFAVVA